jgi:hypothetical protein
MERRGMQGDAMRWQMAGDGLDVTVEWRDGALLAVIQGAGITGVPRPLGAVSLDGRPLRLAPPHRAEHGDGVRGARRLTLEAVSEPDGLIYRQIIEVTPDRPFARFAGELHNAGTHTTHVTAATFMQLSVVGAPSHVFHVEQFSWQYRRDFFSQNQVLLEIARAPHRIAMGSHPSHYWAPSSCAWLALRPATPHAHGAEIAAGPGLVIGFEFNGKFHASAWAEPRQTHVSATIDALNHRLAPGATFDLPAWFVGAYDGDWDEAGYVTQRFSEAYIAPPLPDARYPWVQYNSWKYGREIDEQQQLAVIERCARLGIELVVLDLGWSAAIGDWRPDPVKFPRGLRPLAERARALGMRFGVHLALPQCSVSAPIAQQHPEWIICPEVDDYFGAASLCLGHEPCRDWLIGEILRLIDEEGIEYIIHDGEDMVKHCTRTDHSHAPGDSNYANSQRGIDVVMSTVRRERPHVVLENCEDGGCMMTFRMVRTYDTSITVDNIAAYATRQGIYGASYPFSPRYSVRYMEDDPTPYTLRSSIFGGPLILMQRLTEWSDADLALTIEAIAQYKRLRGLIRDARILHLVPPRANVERRGIGWDAIGALQADGQRAVVFVFRALGGPDRFAVRLRALDPAASYAVSGSDAGALGVYRGAALMAEGITLQLGEESAEILELERQAADGGVA